MKGSVASEAQKHLRGGERIVWTGRPRAGLLGRLKWVKLTFLAVFAALAALDPQNLLMNLFFLLCTCLWIASDYIGRRRTSYALTTERVIAMRPPRAPRWIGLGEHPEPRIALGTVQFGSVTGFTLEGLADPEEFLHAYRSTAHRARATGPEMAP